MKINKYLLSITFIIVAILSVHQVFADSAPPLPSYKAMRIDPKIGLESFSNRFVLIAHYTVFGDSYEVVTVPYVDVSGSYWKLPQYFALDKKYFEQNGGIDGIFSNNGDVNGENYVMSPKNPDQFNAHKYDFIVSKDDPDLQLQMQTTNLIDNKYVPFPFKTDIYLRLGPDDTDCNTGYSGGGSKNCDGGTKVLTYIPQSTYCQKSVCNKLILVNSSSSPQQVQESSSLSIWQRILAFIRSLF